VVVACFDEEPALPRLFAELGKLDGLAGERGLRMEHVLVDDGSRDRTGEMIRDWCGASPSRRTVVHRENRGFGAAMRTGFSEARGHVIVSYDADATYPVEDVLRLNDALDSVDVAGASPFGDGGRSTAAPLREWLSRLVARLYRLALRGRAGDLTAFTCAFRAYRRVALRGVAWRADGFLAAAEVLSRLLLAGARVSEIPSALERRKHGRSKMRFLPTALAHLRLVLSLALRSGGFRARARPRPAIARPRRRIPRSRTDVAVLGPLAEWNAALNREWPMRRIARHPSSVVRAIEERRRRGLLRLTAPRRGQVVLDVGAEEGANTLRLAERGARPVAVDIDPETLRSGFGAHGRPSVTGDAHALPFADRSVPRVLLAEVLEHCPRPADVLAEALRVVSASGRVALSVPDDRLIIYIKRAMRLAGLSRLTGGLPPDRAPGHLHEFGRESLRELLASSGRLLLLTRDLGALAFLAVVAPRPEED
jgi:glycosyltransferase involved in cell wall biosynthesis/SAM-dependent methyltransferase